MSENNPVLGFIGIGLMGKPMVLRLLAAGSCVNVWNRSAEKLQPVTAAGAIACTTVADLTKAADVLLVCLADTAAVEAVVHDGILANGSAAKLLIDLSSIHPDNTRQLAAKLQESCGMGWVDAPVSGGVAGAEQGALAIMAGGASGHIAVARRVLAPLYQRPHGRGRQRADHQNLQPDGCQLQRAGDCRNDGLGAASRSRCPANPGCVGGRVCRFQTLANSRPANGGRNLWASEMAR